MRSLKTTFALTSLLLATALSAQNPDAAAIDAISRAAMDAWKIPGLAIAVVKDDRVIVAKGYGVRELGGAAVTPDTLFQLASTSKAFTTTAMAMLVDEKKMKWDDPVRQHVDYFHLADPCADSLVTVRDIVSHRSGLSSHDELWDYGPWSREEILRRVSSVELSRPIRSAYQYNNIMFMAATEVVASAGKTPFEQFVRARIFEPLGMKNTVVSESEWARAEHATSYDLVKGTLSARTTEPYAALGGAGSIKSSARDMAQWLRFQLGDGVIDGKRLVSEAALRETRSPQVVVPMGDSAREDNPESNILTYGLGWRVQDYRGDLLVFHTGSLNGFRAQVALLPKRGAGVVVLSSLAQGYAGAAIRNSILDLLLNSGGRRDWNAHYASIVKKTDDKAAQNRQASLAKRRTDTKPSRELPAYAGTYNSTAYGTATIANDGNGLVLKWQRLTLPLTHWTFDTFSAINDFEELDERVVFTLNADGDVASMKVFGEEFKKQ
jgi:CubicO group peptidase (beta-lactamase class C family)